MRENRKVSVIIKLPPVPAEIMLKESEKTGKSISDILSELILQVYNKEKDAKKRL